MLLMLAGCETPAHMHVRTGTEPINEDKDVRFRTTYYLRTVNTCEENKSIKEDTLFRVRMTGKADAMITSTAFESGVLHRSQIEGFAQSVRYDDDKKKFSVDNGGNIIASTEQDQCKDGNAEFQIWGPQGVKRLKADERLVMALSIDSKPLIQTLNDLSKRTGGNSQPLENQRAKEAVHLKKAKLKITNDLASSTPPTAGALQKILNDYGMELK